MDIKYFTYQSSACVALSTLLIMTCISYGNSNKTQTCRDRTHKALHDKAFKLTTCAMCYFYLVKDKPEYNVTTHCTSMPIIDSLYHRCSKQYICPDIENENSIQPVCATLSKTKCLQWKICCSNAWECCRTQKSKSVLGNMYCPQTWDGWGCWDFTEAGTTQYQSCPSFLEFSKSEAHAVKSCMPDGTWYKDNKTGLEKTDYTGCSPENPKFYRNATLISIILNCLGIALLIPSILIFTIFRTLRMQHRIQIHIQLCLSLLISGVFVLCWDIRVRWNMIENQTSDIITEHEDLCKFMSILRRFSLISPFFWMLCEGYFLHRLLVKAFEPHKRLYGYHIFAWGIPVLLICLYTSLRKSLADDKNCWLVPSEDYTGLEWILFIPTLVCLAMNLIFFLNIMRILLRQISRLPSEPNNYRRALKATFILIPLFGIQQFFQIYQPLPGHTGSNFFQISGAVINNSQGILIALIFCFFNGEVINHFKNFLKARKYKKSGRRKSTTSQTTSRRLSASSVNLNGFHHVSSFQNLVKAAAKIAEDSVIEVTDNDHCPENTEKKDNTPSNNKRSLSFNETTAYGTCMKTYGSNKTNTDTISEEQSDHGI